MTTADAHPTKRFFVEMLVRDIELKDALLDLLDNCVDGVMRSAEHGTDPERPYEGYWAKINFDSESFCIVDNCGGIPLDLAERSAFRLGRKEEDRDGDLPTVGLYGIGMKRAIFKMGQSATVTSQRSDHSFKVEIPSTWMTDDDAWEFSIEEIQNSTPYGTTIQVNELRPSIAKMFSQAEFLNDFLEEVSAYYSYIIEKGFKVTINNQEPVPRKLGFILETGTDDNGNSIAPYVYRREGADDGVDVYLSVGLYRNSPTEEDEDQELAGRASSESAGWTIICNDRVVLYADKTRLTGWGEATVPAYHTQFVAISGVVIFQSNDPSKLPLTTTKRGVDANSELYSQIKDFMREGMKQFTNYTNQWKKRPKERRDREQANGSVTKIFPKEAARSTALTFSKIRKPVGGEVFRPSLPGPATYTDRWIRFSRPESEIRLLSQEFFGTTDAKPSEIGEECFTRALKELEA
ncbi:ATP-binding protein [Xanthomonas campestris]|nr:ATP-binding protein [Xanthomonas campestris]